MNETCLFGEDRISKHIKVTIAQVQMNKFVECKNVNVFFSISLTYVLGSHKNRLIETVLLSTHTICFG